MLYVEPIAIYQNPAWRHTLQVLFLTWYLFFPTNIAWNGGTIPNILILRSIRSVLVQIAHRGEEEKLITVEKSRRRSTIITRHFVFIFSSVV